MAGVLWPGIGRECGTSLWAFSLILLQEGLGLLCSFSQLESQPASAKGRPRKSGERAGGGEGFGWDSAARTVSWSSRSFHLMNLDISWDLPTQYFSASERLPK